jgi:NADPH:quinone reductase-like Zn-dependent oxidoreductase
LKAFALTGPNQPATLSGQVATTMGAADEDALAARTVRATNVRGNPTPERLNWLAEQVAAGSLRIEIQATHPLADAADALAAFAAGTRGKIVLTVNAPDDDRPA